MHAMTLRSVPDASADPAPSGLSSELDLVEERRLLTAVGAGDRDAAERLVQATYGTIYAALVRMCGNPDTAADLTQDTYRRAWKALDGFEGRSRFSTWLYRIAYTTFLNHVRRPRRLLPMEEGIDPEDPSPGPEARAGDDARTRRLRRAVLALPDEERYLVSAHFWGERTLTSLAQQAGITPPGLRKRLHKALGRLAVMLEDESDLLSLKEEGP